MTYISFFKYYSGMALWCFAKAEALKSTKSKSKHSGLVKPTAKEPCLHFSSQQATLLHFTFLHYCIYLVKVSSQSSFTQLFIFSSHGYYFPSFVFFQHRKFAGKSPITHAHLGILCIEDFLCENVNFPKELRQVLQMLIFFSFLFLKPCFQQV